MECFSLEGNFEYWLSTIISTVCFCFCVINVGEIFILDNIRFHH